MTLSANTTYKGVRIGVYLRDGRAVASLVKGDRVEHHIIENNPIEAHRLTNRQALLRAKGLLS